MKNLIPKRRFEEFKNSDPWEQRELGSLTNIKTGSSDLQDAVDDGEYPLFVRSENIERSNRYIFDGEAILIPGEGRLGEIYHYINGKFDYHQRVYKISNFADSNTDGKFVLYYLQRNFKSHALKFTVKATVDSLRLPMLVGFEIKLPSFKEQKVIGQFFTNLDNLITLHQRKLDKLKETKSAYLSEMFPKEGEFYPKRRFAGFTDPWEQRKLGELCIKFTDGDWIESKDQSYEGVRLIQTGNVGVTQYLDKSNSQKWISEETFDRLHCEEIFPGDILISRLPEPAGRACIIPDIGIKMITAVDCTIVRTKPEVSNKYLVQYLSTENYFKKVNTSLAGGTRQRVSRSNLSEFIVPMPKDEKEQKRIGLLFENLDNLITLHQRKLDKLQALKQAYLSEMFV